MLELIRNDRNIDFFKLRPWAFGLSGLLTVLGIAALIWRGGPNYGIDFTGGIMLHVKVDPSVTISDMRSAVDRLHLEEGGASVQEYGGAPGEYLLRLATSEPGKANAEAERVRNVLTTELKDKNFTALRTEVVGPRVGAELRQRAILAVLLSTVMMGIYIAFRFDRRFGAGAAIALLHDVMVTVGALAIANMEVDLTVVAALLTIVGYSVTDTVVVADRIRENMHRSTKENLRSLINRSINETLSRTLLTSTTTLLVCTALFIFGGAVIHAFAFSLLVGIVTGTYSSIFIASPIVEMWKDGGTTLGKAT
ncbi:MAG TPA: protein translocase subunit SecF [Candidatus Limnocylindrales bacterium]|nr:protein translocase subunit SecF [Candidatus Limnocylindrales bacterium]